MKHFYRKIPGQKVLNSFIWLLIAVPILSIFTEDTLEIDTPFIYIVYIITIILGIIFLLVKKVQIPGFLWLLILYFLYKGFVDFNYNESSIGSLYLTVKINLFIIASFFGLLIIFNSKVDPKYFKILNVYLFCVMIIAPVVTIIQIYNPLFLNAGILSNSDNLYTIRRSSYFAFEDLNGVGVTFVPLAFSFMSIFLLKKRKFLIFYLMCIAIVLIFSNTRYLMFGLFLIFVQLIISQKDKVKKSVKYLFIVLILIVCFFFVAQYIGYNFDNFYNTRINDKENILARVASFNAFFEVFPKNPILGIGNEKAPLIIYNLHSLSPVIHIGYLNHLAVYGILGSSFLFSFFFLLFKRLYVRAKRTNYWAAVMALLFFFWANLSLYIYSIFFSGFLLCLILENSYAVQIIKSKKKIVSNCDV